MADADRENAQSTPPAEDADREHMRRLGRERQRRVIKAVAIVIILVLLVVFVIQNSDPVPVDFILWTRDSRLIYVLLVTAVLGGIVGYLLGKPGKGTRLHGEEDEKKS